MGRRKGCKLTITHRLNISKSRIGLTFSKTHRDNISKSKRGYRHTNKAKLNMIKGHQGLSSWNKGIQMKKSVKLKIIKSIFEHNKMILKLKNQYNKQGYLVLTALEVIPDLILKRGNKLIAIEIERYKDNESRMRRKMKNYKGNKFFNEIKIVDINGK